MRHHFITAASLATLLIGFASTAKAGRTSISLGAEDVTARILAGRGTYYVAALRVPDDLTGKRFEQVVLEFYVDLAADLSIAPEYTPLVQVFPLTEEARDGQPPRFSDEHPSSRPVPTGVRQKVLIDITEIVRCWVASPSTNHGLVIGSFRGPIIDGLVLRDDVLGQDIFVLATFRYQRQSSVSE